MTTRQHILIVEDEKDLAELLEYNLGRQGYTTTTAHSGRAALDAIASRTPDLILLDVMLPEFSGTEIAGRVRSNPKTSRVPIIMLTAKSEEIDQVLGLTVGADDYITKPFSTKVLLARIEALLRRSSTGASGEREVLRLGPVTMDLATHEVQVAGQVVKLTLTEFRLLAALIQGGGRVQTRAALMGKAMGPGVTVTERTIDVHVTSIRKKLGPASGYIRTVRGVGYRISDDPSEAADADDDVASARRM